ncbi:18012_t:CDS:2, partial [Entrophospora sp. SA101]
MLFNSVSRLVQCTESRFAIFACLEVLVSGSLVKSLQTLSRSPFMEFERWRKQTFKDTCGKDTSILNQYRKYGC